MNAGVVHWAWQAGVCDRLLSGVPERLQFKMPASKSDRFQGYLMDVGVCSCQGWEEGRAACKALRYDGPCSNDAYIFEFSESEKKDFEVACEARLLGAGCLFRKC